MKTLQAVSELEEAWAKDMLMEDALKIFRNPHLCEHLQGKWREIPCCNGRRCLIMGMGLDMSNMRALGLYLGENMRDFEACRQFVLFADDNYELRCDLKLGIHSLHKMQSCICKQLTVLSVEQIVRILQQNLNKLPPIFMLH